MYSFQYNFLKEHVHEEFPRSVVPVRHDVNELLCSRKVFIDTCTLMSDAGSVFIGDSATFNSTNVIFYIIGTVLEELFDHAYTTPGSHASEEAKNKFVHAKNAISLIHVLCSRGQVKIVDDDIAKLDGGNAHADKIFRMIAVSLKETQDLVFITQDDDLAVELTAENLSRSVSGRPVRVYKADADLSGGLVSWDDIFARRRWDESRRSKMFGVHNANKRRLRDFFDWHELCNATGLGNVPVVSFKGISED